MSPEPVAKARVLVTRAEPGASETAERLRAMGCEAIVAPLLTIEPVAANTDLSGLQALLFTSANGVAAFARATADRALPAFCVGEATGDAARAEGFTDIRVAGGDVRALADLVTSSARQEHGSLLHAAGADLAGDLKGALEAQGFTVERRIFYRAIAAAALPPMVDTMLAADSPAIHIVLFHSARAAEALVRCARPDARLNRITALCLSDAVAAAARGRDWRAVVAAQEPREAALLALLPTVPVEN
jgi:uroporphyrinogen-III synthase